MKQQGNRELNNESILFEGVIEDLSASHAEEIKGGPRPKSIRIVDLQSSVTGHGSTPDDDETLCGTKFNHNESFAADTGGEDEAAASSLNDLPVTEEQEEEVKGGPGSTCGTWRCGFNHNETVVSDVNNEDEATIAKLADLTVAEEQAEETKGGMLLPAVQKVREAAARPVA
ncbi:MAG: hypothetical protein HONDAALG_04613 [Gammaproteobacteria bacterium]|nr:hypothetical protein [Gammaproteobacteria bacterium]